MELAPKHLLSMLHYLLSGAALVTALCSCHSKKDIARKADAAIDSVSVCGQNTLAVRIDSAFRNVDFTFDTLCAVITHDSAELVPRVEIRAVRGHISHNSRRYSDAVRAHERLDTIAYHQASSSTSQEHTATTAVYNPPNSTAVIGILALVAVCAIYLFIRFRK